MSVALATFSAGGRGPDELNQVMLPIIDREVCNQPSWYDGSIDDSMVCAGYAQGGRDTCQVYADTHTHTHTHTHTPLAIP